MGKQKKYNYAIIVNSGRKEGWIYQYKFAAMDIKMYLQENSAYVSFCLGKKKSFDEIFSFKLNYLVDIMRKIFLAHAIEFSCGLKINSVAVVVDNEIEIKTDKDAGFPYMFSMINALELNIHNWRENRNFERNLLEIKKSKANNNQCVASVYSYLASKGRQFEIDRFMNLWTSMNAYYNYLSMKFDLTLKSEKEKKKAIKRTDSKGIIATLIKLGALKNKQNCKPNYSKLLNALAKGYGEGGITELYTLLESNKTELFIDSKNEIVKTLNDIASEICVTPYGIMLLKFPYYLRCKYIHGNKCTVLFSAYEGRDIAILKVASYFLERYLKDAIPEMTNDNFLSDELRNKIYSFM